MAKALIDSIRCGWDRHGDAQLATYFAQLSFFPPFPFSCPIGHLAHNLFCLILLNWLTFVQSYPVCLILLVPSSYGLLRE